MTEEITSDLVRKIPELKEPLSVLETKFGSFDDMPTGKHAAAVMGQAGDTKHIWDKNKPDEVEAMRAMYDTLTKKGYRAFQVTGKDGEKGEQMTAFDPNAERVIFVPQLVGG